MPQMCFEGTYRQKHETDNKDKNKEKADVFDMMADAIRCGISYEDMGKMNFVMLANIIDAMMPSKHEPTQAEIDLIT